MHPLIHVTCVPVAGRTSEIRGSRARIAFPFDITLYQVNNFLFFGLISTRNPETYCKFKRFLIACTSITILNVNNVVSVYLTLSDFVNYY